MKGGNRIIAIFLKGGDGNKQVICCKNFVLLP